VKSSADSIEEGWGFDEPLNGTPESDDALTGPPVDDDESIAAAVSGAPGAAPTNDWDFDDADIDLT